jgi:hypothetical protein
MLISTDIVVLLVFAPFGISLEVDSSSSRERFLVPGPREILEEICWSIRRHTLDTLDRNATHQHF